MNFIEQARSLIKRRSVLQLDENLFFNAISDYLQVWYKHEGYASEWGWKATNIELIDDGISVEVEYQPTGRGEPDNHRMFISLDNLLKDSPKELEKNLINKAKAARKRESRERIKQKKEQEKRFQEGERKLYEELKAKYEK